MTVFTAGSSEVVLYGAKRHDGKRSAIRLEPVSLATPEALMTDPGAARAARAATAFFGMGLGRGKVQQPARTPALPHGPFSMFRDPESQLLRMAYREIVVRLKPEISDGQRRKFLKGFGLSIRRVNRFVSEQVIVVDEANARTGPELVDLANRLSDHEDEVVFASPNFVSEYRRTMVMPAIPQRQWHLENRGLESGQKAGEDVNALNAWRITTGLPHVLVAVLDDGVDVEHPSLKDRLWNDSQNSESNGRDFFVPDDDPDHFNPRPKKFRYPFNQMNGNDIHGTPCAGIIAANGTKNGPVGIAPGCRILPIKIFHADEIASDERVADAIRFAGLEANADVLSCSWGTGENPEIEFAIQDVVTRGRGGKGCLVFCAAGNDYGRRVSFPARLPGAIAIGASTDTGQLAAYSNVGKELAFVAPSGGGVANIYTTDVSLKNRGFHLQESYTSDFSGTSAATPLAAGIGALVLSVRPELPAAVARRVMAETAQQIGSPEDYDADGHSDRFGAGRLNAAKAVEYAKTVSLFSVIEGAGG